MERKLKIAFFAGRCLPIHAYSLEERPLGGTETGIIRVANALQGRGHDVTVFTRVQNPPISSPRYVPIDQLTRYGPFDVLVSVMDWHALLAGIPAKRNFFWTGDSFDQFANFGIGDLRVSARIDRFLAVSAWHADSFCEETGFPRQKAWVIGNGVNLPYFDGNEARVRKRLIYSSAPYRGLTLVPSIYLALKQRVPDAELHVFAGLTIYDTDRPFEGPELQQYRRIEALLRKLPDCVVHGNVLQRQLAREFMKASVLFYPNVFVETSCISALEALAGGCAVVTSQLGALPETVAESGIIVRSSPGTDAYIKEFSEATEILLTNDGLFAQMSQLGMKRIRANHGWEQVTDRFEQCLSEFSW